MVQILNFVVENATGYTPCELAALVGGAMHPASLHDALAEQSALTRSQAALAASFRLIMRLIYYSKVM